jgi:SPASM domain peptide maturase of grasp-with-spasm system
MTEEIKDMYLYLFANCIPVKGHSRSTICDIDRSKVFFIDNPYYLLLTELQTHTIGEVENMLDSREDVIEFYKFIKFLVDNELGTYVDDISVFPPIQINWDHPSLITNCIIDVRDTIHDFNKIFIELDELNVFSIQIRCYSSISNKELEQILAYTKDKDFRDIQILFKYSGESNIISSIHEILEEYHNLYIQVHSTPKKDIEKISKLKNLSKRVEFYQQEIHSCEQCGIINQKSLIVPSIETFMENHLYNGCLNRKISIDENGEIKNCPSMEVSYGHINNTDLRIIAKNKNFQILWSINKDLIDICKNCELRYLCSDCRAYVNDKTNIFSKPIKCKYNPETNKWQN